MSNSSGRVLVVEDDPLVRRGAVRFLVRAGFSVLEATDGEEAIELVRARSAELDVVFLDLGLPGLSGTATLARLRDLDATLPIVVVSGSDVETLEVELQGGAVSFIQKPYYPRELVAAASEYRRGGPGLDPPPTEQGEMT
ncbi:MAG: response regulator [Acidobacteriota bacterium]